MMANNKLSDVQKKDNYNKWLQKQKTFSNLSIDHLKYISSLLWFPFEKPTKVKSNSWFNIESIINPIFDPYTNFIYDQFNIAKNKILNEILNHFKCDSNKILEIIEKEKIIDDYQKQNNIKVKPNKKHKSKNVLFDPLKIPCKHIILCTYNNILYGRECGNICDQNTNKCKDHTNKNDNKCNKMASNLCTHIITQKSGGKNGKIVVDRKGMFCNDFTFKSSNPKYCPEHNKSHKTEDLENKVTEQRAFKIRFYPNKNQVNKLEEFFGSYRKTYNLCIENDVVKNMTKKEVKKKYVTDCENHKYLKNIPEDIRTFAVSEYFTNYNNANDKYIKDKEREQWKANNYLNYTPKNSVLPKMKYLEKNESQSINVDKGAIKIVKKKIIIYPKIFGKNKLLIKKRQKKDKKFNKLKGNINHDIKIIKTNTDKYYICFVADNEIVKKKEKGLTIAVDVNIRNLVTSYSEKESSEYGANIYDSLRPMIEKRKNMKKEKNKKGEEMVNEKIKNKINDLHYKVIAKLTNVENKLIIIPILNVRNMLEKDETHKTTKKMATIESHSLFIKRLKEKGKLNGTTIKIINENMTTQTCGNCFNKYIFKGETYECKNCGMKIGRDINSARNIFIKDLGKMKEYVNYLININK